MYKLYRSLREPRAEGERQGEREVGRERARCPLTDQNTAHTAPIVQRKKQMIKPTPSNTQRNLEALEVKKLTIDSHSRRTVTSTNKPSPKKPHAPEPYKACFHTFEKPTTMFPPLETRNSNKTITEPLFATNSPTPETC